MTGSVEASSGDGHGAPDRRPVAVSLNPLDLRFGLVGLLVGVFVRIIFVVGKAILAALGDAFGVALEIAVSGPIRDALLLSRYSGGPVTSVPLGNALSL
jgi:hypothetical protein